MLCELCGGHGSYSLPTTADDPDAIRRFDGRLVLATDGEPRRLVECRACDGSDNVTPLLEQMAEESA